MTAALQLVTVFGLGAVEIWWGVPAGFASGLHPALVFIAAAAGGISGVIVVVTIARPVREMLVRRFKGGERDTPNRRQRWVQRIWERYGVIGFGLLGPFVLGPPLSAAVGMALSAPRDRLVVWLCVGVLASTTVVTAACLLGWTAWIWTFSFL